MLVYKNIRKVHINKLILVLLLLGIFSLRVFSNEPLDINSRNAFRPGLSIGLNFISPWVIESPNEIRIVGTNLGYNFNLFSRKYYSLAFEPTISYGISDYHSNRGAFSGDIALINRFNFYCVSIGVGFSSGFTKINQYYNFIGLLGYSIRMGVNINPRLMIEVQATVQDTYYEGKGLIGVNLIWMKVNRKN